MHKSVCLTCNWCLQLCSLYDGDTETAKSTFQLSRDPLQEFPLAIVSINCTKYTLQVSGYARGRCERELSHRRVHLCCALWALCADSVLRPRLRAGIAGAHTHSTLHVAMLMCALVVVVRPQARVAFLLCWYGALLWYACRLCVLVSSTTRYKARGACGLSSQCSTEAPCGCSPTHGEKERRPWCSQVSAALEHAHTHTHTHRERDTSGSCLRGLISGAVAKCYLGRLIDPESNWRACMCGVHI